MIDPLSTAAITHAIGSNWSVYASFTVVVGAILGFFKWVRPGAKSIKRDLVAGRDSILGRDEVKDSITGKVIQPALPGIGVRMANQELQMATLTKAVSKIADSHSRLDAIDARQDRLEAQQNSFKEELENVRQARFERALTKTEAIAAWNAIEAAAKAQPPEEPRHREVDK